MANDKQLTVTIGAVLSAGFRSVIASSKTQLRGVSSVIKKLEQTSAVTGEALNKLKANFNSLNSAFYRQDQILAKRAGYKAQIMDVIALGASLGAPIKAAMSFESVMADVKKVVDFSEADGLDKLKSSLLDLSRAIPLSVEGLGQITAAGGQLGVAEKDLVSFTENVAKMSTAFDMLPDEAGKSMATLSNVFGIPITQLTEVGDAINHISNNSAAAARAIVPALAKAGGSARTFGLSAQNTTALVGTLIAMGRAPEEAGTAVGAILQRLQLADKLGPKAEKAFRQIGISAKAFGRMIEEDAQRALNTFLEKVSKIPGQARTGVLVNIFGKDYSRTVAGLIQSLDKYKAQLDLVSNPKNYAGSMEKEFIERSKTTENNLQLLKNAFSEIGIMLGSTLLPAVNGIVSTIRDVLYSVTQWLKANPQLASSITHTIGGMISFKLVTFAVGYASTFLMGGLNRLAIVFKGLRLGLSLAGVAFRSFFGWPAALAAVAFTVWQNWDKVKEYLQNIWNAVAPYWDSFKDTMDRLGITAHISNAWSSLQKFFGEIWKDIAPALDPFLKKMEQLGVTQYIIDAWNKLKNFFTGLWDNLSTGFDTVVKPLSSLWDKFKGTFGFETKTEIAAAKGDLKLPDVKNLAPVHSPKTQNNNFTITINGAKNDDAESLSKKVMDKVSTFGKTFLYDPVEGAI